MDLKVPAGSGRWRLPTLPLDAVRGARSDGLRAALLPSQTAGAGFTAEQARASHARGAGSQPTGWTQSTGIIPAPREHDPCLFGLKEPLRQSAQLQRVLASGCVSAGRSTTGCIAACSRLPERLPTVSAFALRLPEPFCS